MNRDARLDPPAPWRFSFSPTRRPGLSAIGIGNFFPVTGLVSRETFSHCLGAPLFWGLDHQPASLSFPKSAGVARNIFFPVPEARVSSVSIVSTSEHCASRRDPRNGLCPPSRSQFNGKLIPAHPKGARRASSGVEEETGSFNCVLVLPIAPRFNNFGIDSGQGDSSIDSNCRWEPINSGFFDLLHVEFGIGLCGAFGDPRMSDSVTNFGFRPRW